MLHLAYLLGDGELSPGLDLGSIGSACLHIWLLSLQRGIYPLRALFLISEYQKSEFNATQKPRKHLTQNNVTSTSSPDSIPILFTGTTTVPKALTSVLMSPDAPKTGFAQSPSSRFSSVTRTWSSLPGLDEMLRARRAFTIRPAVTPSKAGCAISPVSVFRIGFTKSS